MSGDALDSELLTLQNKLKRIQKEIGGGKESLAHQHYHNGKSDRFQDLYEIMHERIQVVNACVEEIRKLEKVGSNPTELISNQSKVRTELNTLNEEFKELDTLYRLEKKKKRSRFTPDELQAREDKIVFIQTSIQDIKDLQRSGYVKAYTNNRVMKMEESDMFKKRDIEMGGIIGPDGKTSTPGFKTQASGVVGQRNNQMTDEHRFQLMRLKERDTLIDTEVEEIGKGVDILHELAKTANEEVKLQNKMLDTLEEKVNDVQDHVTNINEKMKETLEKARKSDKICMDIFCVIIMVGMIIVLYKLSTANQ